MTRLLVSSMIGPGGIFRVTEKRVLRVEKTPSSGIAFHGGHLYRARFSHDELVVDRINPSNWENTASWKIEGGAHPHDLCVHEGLIAVADTLHDRVFWINPDTGAVEREKQFTVLGDAWHINSLNVVDGRLLATIFGRFDSDRAWWGKGPEKRGELIDVETETSLLSGLAAPHAPNRWNDKWLVLNTFDGVMSLVGPEGDSLRDMDLGGWPNGILLEGSNAWVGISDSHRKPKTPPPHGNTPGRMVQVDLLKWAIVQDRQMPTSSVYNIVAAP